jgi:hypothetical protein
MVRYLPSLTPLLLEAMLIGAYEGCSWDEVVYYFVVTTTTIDYGDFVPERESMKSFAVMFIPLAVGLWFTFWAPCLIVLSSSGPNSTTNVYGNTNSHQMTYVKWPVAAGV